MPMSSRSLQRGESAGGRAGIIETTFRESARNRLFRRSNVPAAALVELMQAATRLCSEAGYGCRNGLFFEGVHEVSLIVASIYEGRHRHP